MLESAQAALNALIAVGGNSHAARSARAKLQWRDRFGRWIEMGRGVKFKLRMPNGSVASVTGKFTGVADESGQTGQVYVTNDPNGLKAGFYDVTSANAQEILASLDPAYLQEKGIQAGKDANGNTVGERADADIQDQATIRFSEAPVGWIAKANGNFVTEDNEFNVQFNRNGVPMVWHNGTDPRSFEGWPEVLTEVDRVDSGADWNDSGDAPAAPKAAPAPADDAKKAAAKAAIAEYDTDGSAAAAIDANTPPREVLDGLAAKNETFKGLLNNRDRPADQRTQAQRNADDAFEAKIKPVLDLAAPAQATLPEESETKGQPVKPVDPLAAPLPGPPAADEVAASDIISHVLANGGMTIDLTTGEVASEGFIVATRGNNREIPTVDFAGANGVQSLLQYVNDHEDALSAGGMRLGLWHDTQNDEVVLDVVEQVADRDEAIRLGAERNQQAIWDVVGQAEISTGGTGDRAADAGDPANAPASPEPAGAPAGDPANPGGPDTDPSAIEPQGNVPGAEAPVGDTDSPGLPGEEPLAPDAAPAGAPEPRPAAVPDSALAPQQEADDLPDDTDALQRMADRLEARAVREQDSPAAQAINETLDRVYAKINRANGVQPADMVPEPQTDAPEAPAVPDEAPEAPATPEVQPEASDVPEESAAPVVSDDLPAGTAVEWDGVGGRKRTGKILKRNDKKPENYNVAVDNAARNEPDAVQINQDKLRRVDEAPEVPEETETPEVDDFAQEAERLSAELQEAVSRLEDAEARLDAEGDQAGAGIMEEVDDLRSTVEALQRNADDRERRANTPVTPADLTDEPDAPETPETPAETPEEAEDTAREAADVEAMTLDDALAEAQSKIDLAQRNLEWAENNDDSLTEQALDELEIAKDDFYQIQTQAGVPDDQRREPATAPAPGPVDLPANEQIALPEDDENDAVDPTVQFTEMQITDGFTSIIDPAGEALGAINLQDNGKYGVFFRPSTPEAAKVNALNEESARIWLGDKMADEVGADTNPLTNRPVGEGAQLGLDEIGASGIIPVTPSKVDAIRNYLEGKNVPAARREEILADIDDVSFNQGEATNIINELQAMANKPTTRSVPRENIPETKANPALLNPAPGDIIDPNLIFQDVKRNHPNFITLANGDLAIESREVNGKRYDLVVRRTNKERFFTYVRETDLKTGVARVARLQNETHSYTALQTKINVGKAMVRADSPARRFNRRENIELIPADQNGNYVVAADPIQDFIDGTDLPRTEDELHNKLTELVVTMVNNNVDRGILDMLANAHDLPPQFIDDVVAAVNRRTVKDKSIQIAGGNGEDQPSHVSYDGATALTVGDWVDWTDWRETRPQTDSKGRIIRDPQTGKALNEPNPNYKRVYRGQVRQLRYKTNDGTYVYSDSTYVVFPEINAMHGRKPSKQVARISATLRKVDGPKAPLGEPFLAKKKELAEQERVVGPDTSVPKPPVSKAEIVQPKVDINGQQYIGDDDAPVAIPANKIALAKEAEAREGVSVPFDTVLEGDIINVNDEFATIIATREDENNVTLTYAIPTDSGVLQKVLTFDKSNPRNLLFVLRPREEAPAENTDMVGTRPIDQDVAVQDIPGGHGKIIGYAPDATNGEKNYIIRAGDGLEYTRAERYIDGEYTGINLAQPIQPAAKQDGPAWRFELPSQAQRELLRDLLAEREIPDSFRKFVMSTINGDSFTKGKAHDFITDLKTRNKVKALNDNEAFAAMREQILAGDVARKAQIAADNAELAKDPFGGQKVRRIDFADIRYNGARAPFENISTIENDDLRVGDLIPRGINASRRYYQVVAIQQGNGQNKVTLRAIRQDGSKPDDVHVAWLGTRGTRGTSHNVKRPTKFMPDSYWAGERPKYNAPQMVTGLNAAPEPNASPEVLSIADKIKNGWGVKVGRMTRGALNVKAQVITTPDGDDLFLKQVRDNEEFYQELFANRIAVALGISDVHMVGMSDGVTLVMTLINGKPNGDDALGAKNVMENFDNLKNPRLIGLLDYLVNNQDRWNPGNWFVGKNGEPIPNDHGLTMWNRDKYTDSPFTPRALGSFAGRDGEGPIKFTKAELQSMRTRIEGLASMFRAAGYGDWYINVRDKMTDLIEEVDKNG